SGGRGAPQHAEGLADAGALGAVRITQSGRNYTEDGFARQAVPLAHGRADSRPSGAGRANSTGGATTPAGLVDCLHGLGARASAAHPAVADVARYAGTPALVVVVTSDGGPGGHDRAWAVGRDCSASDPHVLHGPVTLP
ncbi:MAG TPA: hypothetical protein VFJ12_02240, partial [Segeticoccus sp.]|nr:hypothetical protein [Segeticoccus sp.]